MKRIIFALVFFIALLFTPFAVYAQEMSLSAATPVKVSEKVVDGDIISLGSGGSYKRSNVPSDALMFGVVALSPALYLYDNAAPNDIPAVSSGKAYVRVSTEEGPIKKGDFITSSKQAGVGVKANNNGYVLGSALEDYEASKPDQIGKILVDINPRFMQTSSNILSTIFTLPSLSLAATPNNALRYIVAAILTTVAFFIGFRFFGRASLKGIEAMGRNPLAKRSIILVVIVNAALTFGIMLVGLTIAYIVVVF